MPVETFFQTFRDDDVDVTCYWGVADGKLSFFVIDETQGLRADVSFRLQVGDSGNIGILTVDGVDASLNGTSSIVHITTQCCSKKQIPMSSHSFDQYLQGGRFPLTIDGLKRYT